MTSIMAEPHMPESVTLEVDELYIRQRWGSGSTHDIAVRTSGDLHMALRKGGAHIGGNGAGLVLVGLDVDGEPYDVVEVETAADMGGVDGRIEALTRAAESLRATIDALRKLQAV